MYFSDLSASFRLGQFGEMPLREAQLGALHAIAAHFTVSDEPALVALPTGVGKTAVANAVPFLVGDVRRVLVVEPSIVLRRQAAAELETLDQLKMLSILPDDAPPPAVKDLGGRPEDWELLRDFDVIVSHPASLHRQTADSGPTFPNDFFDLVIFDEAHHVAAPTWRSIIERLPNARHVLLTATPFRRDRRELRGELVYDYPLSRAVAAGAYHPVEIVPVPAGGIVTEQDRDVAIRNRVRRRLESPEHEHSGLLVRARSKARAAELTELYGEAGIELELIHSGLTPKTVTRRLDRVQHGDVRGAAFVGVLGEGFDCPRLKVGAYHDKHKSLPATLQFIGRLSRTTEDTAGPAEVVTTYEDLRADTWELYRHDAVWREIVPRLVEEASREERARGQMFARLPEIGIGDLSLHEIMVRRQAAVFEILGAAEDWDLDWTESGLASIDLEEDAPFANGNIVWSAGLPIPFLALITAHIDRPDWARSPELDAVRYELHTAAVMRSTHSGQLLAFVTSNTKTNERKLAERISGDHEVRYADAELVASYLDIVDFTRYFGLGLRTTTASGSNLSYIMRAGRQVDQGVAASDTRGHTLGHISGAAELPDHRVSSVGVSPGNARIWDNSYCYLNEYVEWLEQLAQNLHHRTTNSIQRIPNLSAPSSFDSWPDAPVLLAELDYRFYQEVRSVAGHEPGFLLELHAERDPEDPACLGLVASYEGQELWRGDFTTRWVPRGSTSDVPIQLTGRSHRWLSDYLREMPPHLYFGDGTMIQGATASLPQREAPDLPASLFDAWEWTSVDITSETRNTANGQSIHSRVEEVLLDRFNDSGWIIHDDGANELADHVVVAPGDGDACQLVLAHSKPSSESRPGVRAATWTLFCNKRCGVGDSSRAVSIFGATC